jgi:hypothetical protein
MRVIVENDKGRVVYTQWIDKSLISLRKLLDKLEDFFIEISGG